MPPVRTPATRAGKSERTHEENVERAFIAASRRCDRTLEARVESARRASEIHKARTGRGLKITEKDVQNEEMYEEEDDDLPLQYRHLTAGFQTSSPEFNRRFAAYLTTHVAIRTALEQSILQSYAQQEQQELQQMQQHQHQTQQQQQFGLSHQPHQFINQQYERFPSPLLAHHQSQRLMPSVQGSPVSRYSPYPVPQRTNLASPLSQKPITSPTSNVISQISTESRVSDLSSDVSHINSLPSTPIQSSNDGNSISSPLPAPFASCSVRQPFHVQQTENSQNHINIANPLDPTTFGPLSTALPPEAQGFLGPNMNLGDSSNDLFDAVNNDVKLNFDVQIKPEAKVTSCGLDMTLLPDVSVQNSPCMFDNSNYFDDTQRANSLSLTPISNTNEETDWRCFIDRSDPWPFSE